MAKQRRRVFKPALKDYDRSADSPSESGSNDDIREVVLDPEMDDQQGEDQFWKEQRPPHYG